MELAAIEPAGIETIALHSDTLSEHIGKDAMCSIFSYLPSNLPLIACVCQSWLCIARKVAFTGNLIIEGSGMPTHPNILRPCLGKLPAPYWNINKDNLADDLVFDDDDCAVHVFPLVFRTYLTLEQKFFDSALSSQLDSKFCVSPLSVHDPYLLECHKLFGDVLGSLGTVFGFGTTSKLYSFECGRFTREAYSLDSLERFIYAAPPDWSLLGLLQHRYPEHFRFTGWDSLPSYRNVPMEFKFDLNIESHRHLVQRWRNQLMWKVVTENMMVLQLQVVYIDWSYEPKSWIGLQTQRGVWMGFMVDDDNH
jgi:hypothetical protein